MPKPHGATSRTSGSTSTTRSHAVTVECSPALVDGAQLTAFMMDFGIGVNTVSTYAIKRVDTDYFSEE